MSTVTTQPTTADNSAKALPRAVVVYSHSTIFYWWPVWVVGYILALLTWWQGTPVEFAGVTVLIHQSRNLGVIFTLIFLLVIVITHFTVRGVASLTLIVGILAMIFLFAYLGWWEEIFRMMGSLAIFMNLGFYVFFSSAVFIAWALAFFVFDRLEYWSFRPGQVVHGRVFGTGEEAYPTGGLLVEKLRNDLFRHWILGLGSGDLHIITSGPRSAEFRVPNVLFIDGKLARIQQLVAMRPDENAEVVLTAGQPE